MPASTEVINLEALASRKNYSIDDLYDEASRLIASTSQSTQQLPPCINIMDLSEPTENDGLAYAGNGYYYLAYSFYNSAPLICVELKRKIVSKSDEYSYNKFELSPLTAIGVIVDIIFILLCPPIWALDTIVSLVLGFGLTVAGNST